MARRYYSSVAVPTTVATYINDSGTTLALNSAVGFPSTYPFSLILDEDTAYEEVVTVTASLGGTPPQFTIVRGTSNYDGAGTPGGDGTTPQPHNAGAAARHGFSKRDLDEPNEHVNASVAVHGLAGTVVGTSDTQTLSNKTITSPTITTPTLTLKQSASPTPTAEGDIQWDSDDHTLKVGDSVGTKTFSDDTVTAALVAAHEADTSTHGVTTVAGLTETQTFTNKTLTTPTIASFVNATHDHSNAAGGGNVPVTSITGLVGAITAYAGSSAPTGFLLCDGTAVSRATYATLFALIGTTYGSGDGSTTFNTPNLKGKVIVGYKSDDTSFDALGETSGSKTATLTTTELPAHTHTGTTSTAADHQHMAYEESGDQITGSGESYMIDYTEPGPGDGLSAYTSPAGAHNHTFTTDSSGSGAAFSIMNPYLTLNYIIKY